MRCSTTGPGKHIYMTISIRESVFSVYWMFGENKGGGSRGRTWKDSEGVMEVLGDINEAFRYPKVLLFAHTIGATTLLERWLEGTRSKYRCNKGPDYCASTSGMGRSGDIDREGN